MKSNDDAGTTFTECEYDACTGTPVNRVLRVVDEAVEGRIAIDRMREPRLALGKIRIVDRRFCYGRESQQEQ